MKSFIIIINLLFSFVVFSQTTPQEKTIEVILGIDYIEKLDFSPSTKIQIGNESILNYEILPQKREITIKGRKPGQTSVTIRDTVGDIKLKLLVNVTASDQSKIVQELRDYLGEIEGLEIGIKGNRVYIGGKIVVPSDIGIVTAVLSKYGDDIMNLVELSPQTKRIYARNIQQEIQKSNMRDVTVRVVNNSYWLEGIVTNAADKTRAEQIAVAYLPDDIQSLARRTDSVQTPNKRSVIENFIVVNEKKKETPPPKLVKITAQFVELTKEYNKVFGFKWAPTFSETGAGISFGKTTDGEVTTSSSGSLSGTISNLFPKLASAKNAGYARVVQSGVVVTKDKSKAVLKKNSEKKFALGSNEFTRAETTTAGFDLDVTPTIFANENIELAMGISVSSTVGDPPEKFANTISTSIVVKSKESAVVGGVVISTSSTDYDKDGPGGVDQIENGTGLLSFVRSKTYATGKSQFVVFVTPEIVESASEGTEEIRKKFRRRSR